MNGGSRRRARRPARVSSRRCRGPQPSHCWTRGCRITRRGSWRGMSGRSSRARMMPTGQRTRPVTCATTPVVGRRRPHRLLALDPLTDRPLRREQPRRLVDLRPHPPHHPGMDRRRFLLISLAGVLAAPLAAEAQQPAKVHRIGYLSSGSPPTLESRPAAEAAMMTRPTLFVAALMTVLSLLSAARVPACPDHRLPRRRHQVVHLLDSPALRGDVTS